MSLSHQISMGIREVKKQNAAAQECLNIKPIKPELAQGILNAVQLVAAAEPMNTDSWCQIRLEAFNDMARKHRKQWEADTHRRKNNCMDIFHAQGTTGVSAFQAPFYKYQRGAIHFNMKARHKINELCADSFKNRTTRPGYVHEKNTFPPLPEPNNVPPIQNLRLEFITKDYMYGQSNPSINVTARYYSREYRAELLAQTGLLSYEQAMGVLDLVYVKAGREMIRQPNQLDWNLGASLHTENAWRAKTLIIAIACLGSFRGGMIWDMFRQVLVQGGWPWLRQLPKTYVRLNFLAMVSVFGALRHGAEYPNAGELLMQLAGRLVGNPDGSPSTWVVRSKELLDDVKVAVVMPIPPNLQNKKNEQIPTPPTPWTLKDGTEVMEPLPEPVQATEPTENEEKAEIDGEKKGSEAAVTVSATTTKPETEKPLPPVVEPSTNGAVELPASTPENTAEQDPKPAVPEKDSNSVTVSVPPAAEPEPAIPLLPLPTHIIPAAKCNHPVTVPFSGRLKVAHSLADVENLAESKESIVVADTRNIMRARNEVVEWLVEKRVMAVYRGEERCLSCAYRLCHATGGVVIIC